MHTLFYSAHLDRYVAGLLEGQVVSRGEIIAYVGDTGNAGTGNYHLHFSVSYLGGAPLVAQEHGKHPHNEEKLSDAK